MDAQESGAEHSHTAGATTASDGGECETDEDHERTLMPPPSGTPRKLSHRRPTSSRGSRRSLRARRRNTSGSSQYYTSGAEDEEGQASGPKTSRNHSRSTSGQRGGGDQVRPPKIAYVSSETSLPPPQPRDPTLFFTDTVKQDERYGLASAKSLAQMALRDGRETHGQSAEPELIAYHLRMMGAAELIGHRSTDYVPPTDRWMTSRMSEQATQRYGQPDFTGEHSMHLGSVKDVGSVTDLERAEVIAQYLVEKAAETKRRTQPQPTLTLREPDQLLADSQYAEQRNKAQAALENQRQVRAAAEAVAAKVSRQLAAAPLGSHQPMAAPTERPREVCSPTNSHLGTWEQQRMDQEHNMPAGRAEILGNAEATQRQCDDICATLQQYQKDVQVVSKAASKGVHIPLPQLGGLCNYRPAGHPEPDSGRERWRKGIIENYLREQALLETTLTAPPARPRYPDASSLPPDPYMPELITARSETSAALQRAKHAEELVERLRAQNSARELEQYHSLYRPAQSGWPAPAGIPPLNLSREAPSSGDAPSGSDAPSGGGKPNNPEHQKMRCKPPTFTGGNWAAFRQQFEKLARYYQWDAETKGLYLHTSIQGDAADALGVEDSASWSYDQLVEHLDKRHGRSKTYAQVLNEICALFRRADMTNTQWHDAVIKVANTAHLSSEQYKHVAYHGFTFGLRMFPALQTWVLNRDEKRTLTNATSLAEQYEHEYGVPVYVHLPLTAEAATFVHEKVIEKPAPSKANHTDATELAQLVRDMRAQMPKQNAQQAPKKNASAPPQQAAPAKHESAPNNDRQQGPPNNGRGRKRGNRGRGARRPDQGRGREEQRPGSNENAAPFVPYNQPWVTQYQAPPHQPWDMNQAPPNHGGPPPNGYYQQPMPVSTPMLMPPPPAPPAPPQQQGQQRPHRTSSVH